MATPNRGDKIARLHKVLKKHYQPVAPPADRSLLEHLLYACCLENSRHEKADEAFARLQEMYFDWNEIRVTTVTELAEAMGELHDPAGAAARVKRSLQTIFEKQYSFDLENLKKQNLGKATKELADLPSLTPFSVDYVTQHALGGHAIPLDDGALQVFGVLGALTPAEIEKGRVPGLERAIPKNKGVEFAWLLHQLGAEYLAAPFSAKLRATLLEIDPEAKDRLPKRVLKKSEAEEAKDAGPAASRQSEHGEQVEAASNDGDAAAAQRARRTKPAEAAEKGKAADAAGKGKPADVVGKAKPAESLGKGKPPTAGQAKPGGAAKPGGETKPVGEAKHAAKKAPTPTKRLAKKKPR